MSDDQHPPHGDAPGSSPGQPPDGSPPGRPSYGQPPGQPSYGQPYGQPPYGQPQGPPQGQPPYGQPSGQPPYGQPQGPPQGQPPYGQPSGQPPYGQPGGPPGWGQQPQWGAAGPSGPQGSQGSNSKLWIIIGGVVLALVVLIAAVAVGVTQFGGEDEPTTRPTSTPTSSGTVTAPTAPTGSAPAEGLMSADGATKLISTLEAEDWTCYDSLSDPVPVKRCFYAQPDGSGTTSARMTLQYQSEDIVGAVSTTATSPSTKQSEILRTVAGHVGDSLLNGNGPAVADLIKSGTSESTEIEGAQASGSDSYFNVYAPDFDFSQIEAPPLPPFEETRSAIEDAGLRCDQDGRTVICDGEVGGTSLSAIASVQNGEVASGWSVSADGRGQVKGGAQAVATLLRDTGLTDDDGAAFVAANPQDGQAGDFAGYAVSIIISSSSGYYNLLVSVDQVR